MCFGGRSSLRRRYADRYYKLIREAVLRVEKFILIRRAWMNGSKNGKEKTVDVSSLSQATVIFTIEDKGRGERGRDNGGL